MEKSQKEIIEDICKEFEVNKKGLAELVGVAPSTLYNWIDSQKKIPNSFFKTIDYMREIKTLKNN